MDWFWALKIDDLIIPWMKGNVIPLSMLYAVLKWWTKRTPSPEDDELIDKLWSVLPMMKRNKG